MRRWIRSLPWQWQLLAWPLAALPLILGWAAKEMAGQAKTKAQKAFAPLLWPAAGALGLVVLFGALGPEGFGAAIQIILTLALMALGVKIMVFGFPKPKKKKKGKRK